MLSSRYLHTYTSLGMGDDQMLQSVLMVDSPALQMGEDWMPKQDLPKCFVNDLVLYKDLLAADVHQDIMQASHCLCLHLIGCSMGDTLVDVQR
jgi:hypothetical protein